ncbi:MAG: nucleotidyltransferase family protein [Pseudomonadota bacterium]|nr:nucleotidyltransferase family protein [Pseudomonadota bacterium]
MSVSHKPTKAMILAAGRGNRLRPLTDTIPKPLVPFCGKPLIEYHIEKLAKIGVKEIVINHAWLGHKIEAALGCGERWNLQIHYSAEPEGGLETAGGIINALPLLGEEPFILVNGDVFTDLDFQPLLKQAQLMQTQIEWQAYLMLVPSPEHNTKGDFGLTETALVTEQGEHTFAGISVLKPELFANMPVDFIRLAPILREAMNRQQASGDLYTGFWSDIGTLERLQQTEQLVCK